METVQKEIQSGQDYKFYWREVVCKNCGFRGNVAIPKTLRIEAARCAECECIDLALISRETSYFK